MSRHTSDSKQRASKKYQAIHAQLVADVLDAKRPKPTRIERHRMESMMFLQHGATADPG